MRIILLALFVGPFALSAFLQADCNKDNRSNKNAGVLVTDFTITGTQSLSTSVLASMTGDLIGSCFDEDSEEMAERVRLLFQQRGYFKAEVKDLRLKAVDPLGVPKPVILESEVSEGPQYRLADVTFLKNHAFAAEKLRQEFPIQKGDIVDRDKVAMGLESLRKLYLTRGYRDFACIPETKLASNATLSLSLAIEEGPQYHMGDLEILGTKEEAAQIRTNWKLIEGDICDNTYLDQFLEANRDVLPPNFTKSNIETFQNCPEALVTVRLIIDPVEKDNKQLKNIRCEEQPDVSHSPEASPR